MRLRHLSPNPDIAIWAKLEWYLPTGSVKDRIAALMLRRAEEGGLQPGAGLLAPSSGNMGIALARLARLRGYELTVVIPDNVGQERKDLLRAFGARLIETPGAQGPNGAIDHAHEIAAAGDRTLIHQYEDEANPEAHATTTGPEILNAVDRVDAFVAGLGTGGTLMGVGRALRERHPGVKVVAAEPPVGETVSGLRSMGDGYTPPIFDASQLDGRILVRAPQAVEVTRRLLLDEGLFAGPSSGAAAHAAMRWAEKIDEGTIVTLFPDGGFKYLSSGLWTGTVDEAAERLGGQLYF